MNVMNAPRLRFVFVLASLFAFGPVGLGATEPGRGATEVPPSVLKRYDKNKDGALDDSERAKWEADKVARREKERSERAALLEKYDTDKDGKLSEEEKAEAKLGWQKERSEKETEKMKERVAKAKEERERAEKEKAARESSEKPADERMMMMAE